jgi:hypothetical protein
MASIYGRAVHSDGSKVDRNIRIITSWNGNDAFSRNGKYDLDLGVILNNKLPSTLMA